MKRFPLTIVGVVVIGLWATSYVVAAAGSAPVDGLWRLLLIPPYALSLVAAAAGGGLAAVWVFGLTIVMLLAVCALADWARVQRRGRRAIVRPVSTAGAR